MKFNEHNHTYFNDKDEQYISGTSLIKMFCKPFDREKIATKYAKKHKKSIQDVLDEWDKAGKDAIKKGIAFHSIKEKELNEKPSILIDDEEHPIVRANWEGDVKLNVISKLEPGIYPELLVWSDKYKVAGQADYVEVTKKGFININDYKTSKEIKKNSSKSWDGRPDMLKTPLNYLEDCNFVHYCLQINLYAFLIKQHNRNLKINKMSIEHIIGDYNEETNLFSIKESISYKVPNMQNDVKILLDHYKNSK